jgi:hypothetical protein
MINVKSDIANLLKIFNENSKTICMYEQRIMIDDIYDINAYNSDEEPRRPKTIRFRPNLVRRNRRSYFLSN